MAEVDPPSASLLEVFVQEQNPNKRFDQLFRQFSLASSFLEDIQARKVEMASAQDAVNQDRGSHVATRLEADAGELEKIANQTMVNFQAALESHQKNFASFVQEKPDRDALSRKVMELDAIFGVTINKLFEVNSETSVTKREMVTWLKNKALDNQIIFVSLEDIRKSTVFNEDMLYGGLVLFTASRVNSGSSDVLVIAPELLKQKSISSLLSDLAHERGHEICSSNTNNLTTLGDNELIFEEWFAELERLRFIKKLDQAELDQLRPDENVQTVFDENPNIEQQLAVRYPDFDPIALYLLANARIHAEYTRPSSKQ